MPAQRLAFTWNFPPTLPTLRQAHPLVTVELTPEAGGRSTRVQLEQTGWRRGTDWKEGQRYFQRAWAPVLQRLARSFSEGPLDWSQDSIAVLNPKTLR